MFARTYPQTVRDAVLEVDLPDRPELVVMPVRSLGREGGLRLGHVLLQGEDGARLVAHVEETGNGTPVVYAKKGQLLKVNCRRKIQADGGYSFSVVSAVAADRPMLDAVYLGAALVKSRRASVTWPPNDQFVMSLQSGDYIVKKTTNDDVPDLSDWDDDEVDSWSEWGEDEPVADRDSLIDVDGLIDVLNQDEDMPEVGLPDSIADNVPLVASEEEVEVDSPSISIGLIVSALVDGAMGGVHGFDGAQGDAARDRQVQLSHVIDGLEADEDDSLYILAHQSDTRTGAVTRSMVAQENVWASNE
jgi:hypothetical protein